VLGLRVGQLADRLAQLVDEAGASGLVAALLVLVDRQTAGEPVITQQASAQAISDTGSV
jgi:hypothetical protein